MSFPEPKPFLKTFAQPPVPEADPATAPVSVNELTVFAVASAMIDLKERAAYLTRTCGTNDVLRQRVEERIAAREKAMAQGMSPHLAQELAPRLTPAPPTQLTPPAPAPAPAAPAKPEPMRAPLSAPPAAAAPVPAAPPVVPATPVSPAGSGVQSVPLARPPVSTPGTPPAAPRAAAPAPSPASPIAAALTSSPPTAPIIPPPAPKPEPLKMPESAHPPVTVAIPAPTPKPEPLRMPDPAPSPSLILAPKPTKEPEVLETITAPPVPLKPALMRQPAISPGLATPQTFASAITPLPRTEPVRTPAPASAHVSAITPRPGAAPGSSIVPAPAPAAPPVPPPVPRPEFARPQTSPSSISTASPAPASRLEPLRNPAPARPAFPPVQKPSPSPYPPPSPELMGGSVIRSIEDIELDPDFDIALGLGSGAMPTPPAAASAPQPEPKPVPAPPSRVEPLRVDPPKAVAPKIEEPKVEAPKVEAPKVEVPKVEAPKVELPKAELPEVEIEAEVPKAELPKEVPAPQETQRTTESQPPAQQMVHSPETMVATRQQQDTHSAMALIPMSSTQLAALTAGRSNTIPWMMATLFALATGGLSVYLYLQEAETHKRIEVSIEQAAVVEREKAEQQVQLAKREVEAAKAEVARIGAESEQQRLEADTISKQAAAAFAKIDQLKGEVANSAKPADVDAKLQEAEQQRDAAFADQKSTAIVLADTLAKLANGQLDDLRFADAEAAAKQCLELRIARNVEGWPLVEAQALYGTTLLQRNADADAERLMAAAATGIEALGAPKSDADRARFTLATKRILIFFNATGRRKEAADWKAKFDLMRSPLRDLSKPILNAAP